MNWLRGLPDVRGYTDHWALVDGKVYVSEDVIAQVWYTPAENSWYYTHEEYTRRKCDSLNDGMRRVDKALGRVVSESDLLFT